QTWLAQMTSHTVAAGSQAILRFCYSAILVCMRAAAGWNLLVHSWGKITVGPAPGFLKAFVDIGFTPPAPWFWTALFTETLAGIALILGLFTRFFAAAAAI
ncbi:MAG: DoxX family protein, partial [Pseudolabrys sp.]